jgi:hypothetical protein
MKLIDLFNTNLLRAKRWHHGDISEWSALEWAGAMAGEAGEAANAAKKLRRLESGIPSINEPERQMDSVEDASWQVAEECADTIIYALLVMARVGVTDPEVVIRDKFNRTSVKYDVPERL